MRSEQLTEPTKKGCHQPNLEINQNVRIVGIIGHNWIYSQAISQAPKY